MFLLCPMSLPQFALFLQASSLICCLSPTQRNSNISISGPLEMLEMCFVILKEQWPDRAHVLPRGAQEAKTEVGKSPWVKDATCSFPGVTKLRLEWSTFLWWGKGCSLSLAIAIPLKAIRGLGTLFFTQTKLELASPRINGDGSGCLVNKTYKWCCMN